jgi:phage-related protein
MSTLLDTALDQLPTLPGAPKASGAIFDWCVTGANYDLEPKVIKAQFGDGYAQRRPAGINTQARMWSVEMRNITTQTCTDVLDFLKARNGVDVFSWTPPRTDASQTESVICPSWTFGYGDLLDDGSRLYNVTMKFEQVFV